MTTYYTTVGLEIHAELNTKTKMFCKCLNNPFLASPNVHICPVCMAHPGALPVPNMQAIQNVIKVGLAVGGNIANFTEFDRKNYFYPDIPKAYQISQYKYPIVSGGSLNGIALTRIHLEEDTATSRHTDDGTLINFNRAGVPLMELVTEPVIHSAEEAMAFGRELQLLLRYLGVSEANMERGEMRVEVNVSISPDKDVFGTKVEVKNINSFSNAGKAIEYEVERMKMLWEAGRQDEIVQETRGWDADNSKTVSQRTKESAADYRYFPDPDLPKFYLHDVFNLEELKAELPELPSEKRARYVNDLQLKSDIIDVFVTNPHVATEFENAVILFDGDLEKVRLAGNYLTSDVMGFAAESEKTLDQILIDLDTNAFAQIISMTANGDINSRGAKQLLNHILKEGGNPQELAKEQGLIQKSNPEELRPLIKAILAENENMVNQYKEGNESVMKFFMGQVMKQTKGSANPKVATDLLKEEIG